MLQRCALLGWGAELPAFRPRRVGRRLALGEQFPGEESASPALRAAPLPAQSLWPIKENLVGTCNEKKSACRSRDEIHENHLIRSTHQAVHASRMHGQSGWGWPQHWLHRSCLEVVQGALGSRVCQSAVLTTLQTWQRPSAHHHLCVPRPLGHPGQQGCGKHLTFATNLK